MNLLLWIVFGLIAGSIATFLSPSPKMGTVKSIILGIFGAMVGGFLGQMIFGVGVSGFNLPSMLVAVGGSLLILFIGRLI